MQRRCNAPRLVGASRRGAWAVNWPGGQRRPEGPRSMLAAVGLRPYGALVLIAATVGAWALIVGPATLVAGAGQVNQVASLDTGRALYLQGCASCHGSAGQGTPNGPSIVDAGAAGADFELRTGRMPLAAPNLPEVRQPPPYDQAQIEPRGAVASSAGNWPSVPEVSARVGVTP